MTTNKLFTICLRLVWWIIAIPVALFLFLAILIYVPAVQNYAVKKTTEALSDSTGLSFKVKEVRLAFPLDLSLQGVQAFEQKDTILHARALRLHTELLPLFYAQANIKGLSLYDARLNTKSLIAGAHIKGQIKHLTARSRGINWETQRVRINNAAIKDANLLICLSDTALQDSTTTKSKWNIDVVQATLENVQAKIALANSVPKTDSIQKSLRPSQLWIEARIAEAHLKNGHFNTEKNLYRFRQFQLHNSLIAYNAKGQDGTWEKASPIPSLPRDKANSPENKNRLNWRYTDNMTGLEKWNAFSTTGKKFNPDNIVLREVNTNIADLSYNNSGTLRLMVNDLSLKEQSGMTLKKLHSEIYLDKHGLRLPQTTLQTDHSQLKLSLNLPWESLNKPLKQLSGNINGTIGWQDVMRYGRDYVDHSLLKKYPQKTLSLQGQFKGNLQHLSYHNLQLSMPNVLTAKSSGTLHYLSTNPQGKASFNLQTAAELPKIYAAILPELAKSVKLPQSLNAKGNIDFTPSNYKLAADLLTNGGTATIKGHYAPKSEAYTLDVQTKNLPLHTVLPNYGLSAFTGRIKAKGTHFNPLNPAASLDAQLEIDKFKAAGYDLRGIDLQAAVQNSKALVSFKANNPHINGEGSITTLLNKQTYEGNLEANFSNINLHALGLTTDSLQAGASLFTHYKLSPDLRHVAANGKIHNIFLVSNARGFSTQDLNFEFLTQPDTTWAHAESGDLSLQAGTRGSINSITPQINSLLKETEKQWARRELDQNKLKALLPPLNLYFSAGQNNPLYDYARFNGYQFREAYVDLHAHPQTGLSGMAQLAALQMKGMLLDTIDLTIFQDSTGIKMDGFVRNYTKKNPTKFDTRLKAYLLSRGAGIETKFYDEDGEKGVDLGLRADLVENGINLSLSPHTPVLAYRNFKINPDNFIFLGKNKRIRANVDLLADDGTGLKVYSEGTDSVNDITLSVNQINLAELSNVLPFIPKLSGTLSGDMRVLDNHHTLSAMGALHANNFALEGTTIGNLSTDLIYLPKSGSEHYAQAFIALENNDVMELTGTYHTANEGRFDGTATLTDFPLPFINGFLDGSDIALSGKGNGEITLQGALDKLKINGALRLDDGRLYSDAYGFNFKMDEKPIVFDNSRIKLDDFNLFTNGSNPFTLNGSVNLEEMSKPYIDLTMKATNFELINSKQTRASLVFGTVFTNYIGTVKGTPDALSIRGNLRVLDKTNMTYVLKDSPLSVDGNRLEDLIKFTSFTDTTTIAEATTPLSEMKMDMALGISVDEGARFNAFLSEDGQSYASMEGSGNLTLRMTQQGDMRLTGRITANEGEMKYELPIIPLRTFKLAEGSTIDFTGDPMNPTLNIHATERMRVMVSEGEQQRNVAFDVGVAIKNALQTMGLEFTIDAPEDLSVQNQLSGMTKEQRNQTAVAMMATGMYVPGNGLQTSGFKASNALNAFLQNEIQNIAGNALKSFDVSLGVETGTSLTGTQTTDYSFQFAKRFWDDKIRVIIGGRVSAGKNANNQAESLINNVSVEYRMNEGATRYLRVFYDRDQQDPLEGLITRTGLGYSVRRKATNFGELLLFWKKPKNELTKKKEARQ